VCRDEILVAARATEAPWIVDVVIVFLERRFTAPTSPTWLVADAATMLRLLDWEGSSREPVLWWGHQSRRTEPTIVTRL
jgi:hypothetical protein